MPYFHPLKGLWKGQHDGPNNQRLHEVVEMIADPNAIPSPKDPSFAFLGFACDVGMKRTHGFNGAALGPKALREALGTLPVPREGVSYYDYGNIVCEGEDLEEAQEELAKGVNTLLSKRVHPIVLGGGHELSWGNYLGIHQAFPNKKLLIVNFNPHFDMRPMLEGNLGSSGTSFRQVAQHCKATSHSFNYCCYGIQPSSNTRGLFEEAKSEGMHYMTAEDFHLGATELALDQLESSLVACDIVYLSICMDVFASAFAPGVSARQPLGLCPWQVLPLLKVLASSEKVVSLDIAELSPSRDNDNMTAQLAASLLFHYLSSY